VLAASTLLLLVGCSSPGTRRVADQQTLTSSAASTVHSAASTVHSAASTVYGAEATVYVVRRGWHIDVAFAAADLESPLASVRNDFPGANYLTFGFGDRRYLMHRSGLTMLEALWPGPGLVLVTGLRATLEEAFGEQEVIRLAVSQAQLIDVQQFVWDTFAEVEGGVTPLQTGPYSGSSYYASVQRYSGLHTCNTWAAEALQAAGLSIRSRGVEFSGELWGQVEHLHSQQGHLNAHQESVAH